MRIWREVIALRPTHGPYRDKAFRIAHMGETDDSDLVRLFDAIDEYLATMKPLFGE